MRKNCGSVLRTLEDGSGHRRGASIGKQEGSAKGSARGVPLPEMHEAKVQHEHCRQTDAQVVEPGADSTLLIVIVTGEGGKEEYRQVGREYHQSENGNRINPSGGVKQPRSLQ